MGSRLSIFSRTPAKAEDREPSPEKTTPAAEPTPIAEAVNEALSADKVESKCGCGQCKCDPCNCAHAVDTLTEAIKSVSLDDNSANTPIADIAQEVLQSEVTAIQNEVPVSSEGLQNQESVQSQDLPQEKEVPQDIQSEVPQEKSEEQPIQEQQSTQEQPIEEEKQIQDEPKQEQSSPEVQPVSEEPKCMCSPCHCDPCKCGCHQSKTEVCETKDQPQGKDQKEEEQKHSEVVQGDETPVEPSQSENQTEGAQDSGPVEHQSEPVVDETVKEIADEVSPDVVPPEDSQALEVKNE